MLRNYRKCVELDPLDRYRDWETNAMNVLDRCREEVYQREVVFANMIDRVGWARMFKEPAVPLFIVLSTAQPPSTES